MMGHQPNHKNKLFISGFILDERIRDDHLLRKIQEISSIVKIYLSAHFPIRENRFLCTAVRKQMRFMAKWFIRSENLT